jgi:hypothetical protein
MWKKCIVFGAALMLAGCAVEPYGPGYDQGYSSSYAGHGSYAQPGYYYNQPSNYDEQQPGYYYYQHR